MGKTCNSRQTWDSRVDTLSSTSSSSNPESDSNLTNLHPTTDDIPYRMAHGCTGKRELQIYSFLQRANNQEEKSQMVPAFKERHSSKNLMSCENSSGRHSSAKQRQIFANLFEQAVSKYPL
uniref:Uncharacterized protein n=1 Tax=Monodelphis domestica TaxID=13616 RepID=A0A5F8HK23_MONDO